MHAFTAVLRFQAELRHGAPCIGCGWRAHARQHLNHLSIRSTVLRMGLATQTASFHPVDRMEIQTAEGGRYEEAKQTGTMQT
tara:strand:+ start:682 stop:927 length:246 start_codon:yes stop_codon:yes gene_type:complete